MNHKAGPGSTPSAGTALEPWKPTYRDDSADPDEWGASRLGSLRRNPRVRIAVLVAALVLLASTALVVKNGGDDGSGSVPSISAAPQTATVPTVATITPVDPTALAATTGGALWRVASDGCGVVRLGLAFAVDDHTLVTSWPLVIHDETPTLYAADGTTIDAALVGMSMSPDVAVLHVEQPLPSSLLADSRNTAEARQELAVLGWDGTTGTPVVRSLTLTGFRAGSSGPTHAFTTDRTFVAEEAGAPILDGNGSVVGMVSLVGAVDAGVGVSAAGIEAAVEKYGTAVVPISPDCGRGGLNPLANDNWDDLSFGAMDVDYGQEPVLDRLWDRCAADDWAACDDLALTAPIGSMYREMGDTCGRATLASDVACVTSRGGQPFTTQLDFELGTCIVLPRASDGLFRPVPCTEPHDAEVILADRTAAVPPEGPTAQMSEGYATICQNAYAVFTAETPWWDLIWRVGIIAPSASSSNPTVSCFAYVAGVSLDRPLAEQSPIG